MLRLSTPLVVVLASSAAAMAAANGKKLIEWGWDQPTTAFMRQHIAQMEMMPFDGTVFSVNMNDGNSFTDAYWGGAAITPSHLSTAQGDLQATPFNTFTDNFLRLNMTPFGPSEGIDWFDNFGAIVGNSLAAAQVAKDSGVKGILLDTEQYTRQIWDYSQQRDVGTKSWSQYAAQVRQRGYEVMQAFQQGYPDLTLFLSHGYSLPGEQSDNNPANLPNASYGLLAPFLDGMFDAAAGNTIIVDGFELGYKYNVRRYGVEKIQEHIDYMHEGVLSIVDADDEQFTQFSSAGYATWLDFPWHEHGWNPNNDFEPNGNWYTSADLQATLEATLTRVDDYAWVYTEQPRWWTAAGGPTGLPQAYIDAVRNAAAVPEPSSALLLALAAAGLVRPLLKSRRRACR